MRKLFARQSYAESAPELLESLQIEFEQTPGFVLWLLGEMGAGKTSLVRALLYKLGLSPAVPVTSPTYTIMHEYRIAGNWYAHLDLYRAEAHFSLDEIGVRDMRDYRGMFVEWPEQGGAEQQLAATHILRIEADGLSRRLYTFERICL